MAMPPDNVPEKAENGPENISVNISATDSEAPVDIIISVVFNGIFIIRIIPIKI